MILSMKRSILSGALIFAAAVSALILTSCETTENRVSKHPEIYQGLSANDQALVSRGQIRPGMFQNAVWLAWGSPDRKITGNMRGHPTQTWIYVHYETAPYPFWRRRCHCPSKAFRPLVRVLRRSILRSVLLLLHPAKRVSPVQDRHICKWAGCILPIHGTAIGGCRLCGTPDPWLTAPLKISLALLRKLAS